MPLVAVGVATTVLLCWFATRRRWWADEIYSVYAMTRPLGDMIKDSATLAEPIPPGYYLLLRAWNGFLVTVHGLPVPESWLLVPSAVCLGLTVVVTGLAARKLVGPGWPTYGVACLCATSLTWALGGLQLRYYPGQFLTGAVVVLLYVHLDDVRPAFTRRWWALTCALGLAMASCAFMGYSALFWLCGLFVVDLARVIVFHHGARRLVPYLAASFFYTPWLAAMGLAIHRYGMGMDITSFWPARPDWPSIWGVYSEMLVGVPVTVSYVVAVGVIVVAAVAGSRHVRWAWKASRVERRWVAMGLSFIVCPAIMVLLVFVYSRYVVPAGSIFVGRYFYVMWPMMCLTIVVAAAMVWRRLTGRAPIWVTVAVAGVACMAVIYQAGTWTMDMTERKNAVWEPYFEQAQHLRHAPDVGSSGVAVVSVDIDPLTEGWRYFYVTDQGTSDGFTFLSRDDPLPDGTEKVYFCAPHGTATRDFTDVPGFVFDGELTDLKIRIYVTEPPSTGTAGG
ncbi:MAG: hypothetical protein LBK72_06655 [Bifidobacteriaceae bacterium]|nr:hypothetical protein [Bifidobacteriaceae bacterium]